MKDLDLSNTLTPAETCAKIFKSGGTFFGISFVKKNQEVRHMVARKGVYRNLVGGKNTVRHIPRYITVWDVHKRAYRNVNLNTIFRLSTGGEEFAVA